LLMMHPSLVAQVGLGSRYESRDITLLSRDALPLVHPVRLLMIVDCHKPSCGRARVWDRRVMLVKLYKALAITVFNCCCLFNN